MSTRHLKKYLRDQPFLTLISVILVGFILYNSSIGNIPGMLVRVFIVTCLLVISFLIYPINPNFKLAKIIDVVLILLTIMVGGYILIWYEELTYHIGAPTTTDIILGIIAIVLVLEASRRVIGKALPIVSIVFLIYAFIGPVMPGILAHKGYGVERIVNHMYLTMEGMYGLPVGVAVTYGAIFIVFGVVLEKTKMGDFILELAFALAGRLRGGPALVSVVSSGLFGSISGSAVANAVTTGTFTIPLMKRVGYTPRFAGAVEAAASSGGQLMPPIMGAAAFIMAETLGMDYLNIIIAAFIPAVLYFFSAGMSVYLEAGRLDLKGLPKEQLPNLFKTLKGGIHYIIPILVLMYLLVIVRLTPIYSAFYSLLVTIIVTSFNKETRLNLDRIIEITGWFIHL